MNNATVDSNIEHKCQIITEFVIKKNPSSMLATLILQKMQLYKEQLHKKYVSVHKGMHLDVKRMLLKDAESY